MGWRVTHRGGKKVYYHSGDMKGFNAMMGFLPGEDSGFAVLVNTNGTEAESMVGDYLLDVLCGTQLSDADRDIAAWQADRKAYAQRRQQLEALPQVTPSELEALSGSYFHPAYTKCTIGSVSGKPCLQYGVMDYVLHRRGQELVGLWVSDLVPEDYDAITIRPEEGGLCLNTGENTLWLKFQKQ